jgi:hypothetical protein
MKSFPLAIIPSSKWRRTTKLLKGSITWWFFSLERVLICEERRLIGTKGFLVHQINLLGNEWSGEFHQRSTFVQKFRNPTHRGILLRSPCLLKVIRYCFCWRNLSLDLSISPRPSLHKARSRVIRNSAFHSQWLWSQETGRQFSDSDVSVEVRRESFAKESSLFWRIPFFHGFYWKNPSSIRNWIEPSIHFMQLSFALLFLYYFSLVSDFRAKKKVATAKRISICPSCQLTLVANYRRKMFIHQSHC